MLDNLKAERVRITQAVLEVPDDPDITAAIRDDRDE
jgi:hypothetical protein